MTDEDDPGKREPMTDEDALTAMFASLVQDSPASQVSPSRVIELASTAQDAALERRIKRLKLGRNLLVAAVLVGLVVIFAPKLGHSSTESSATSSSSVASAPAAAPVPAESAAPAAGSAAAGSSAAGPAAPGSSAASAAASSATAGSAAAGAGAASSSAAGSEPARSAAAAAPSAANSGECSLLPSRAVLAVRAQFPVGYFGPATLPAQCTGLYAATMEPRAPNRQPLHIGVTRATAGSCRKPAAGPACTPVAGAPGAYRQPTAGQGSTVYVYGNGYQVELVVDAPVGTGVTAADLARAGEAVISSLG